MFRQCRKSLGNERTRLRHQVEASPPSPPSPPPLLQKSSCVTYYERASKQVSSTFAFAIEVKVSLTPIIEDPIMANECWKPVKPTSVYRPMPPPPKSIAFLNYILLLYREETVKARTVYLRAENMSNERNKRARTCGRRSYRSTASGSARTKVDIKIENILRHSYGHQEGARRSCVPLKHTKSHRILL